MLAPMIGIYAIYLRSNGVRTYWTSVPTSMYLAVNTLAEYSKETALELLSVWIRSRIICSSSMEYLNAPPVQIKHISYHNNNNVKIPRL